MDLSNNQISTQMLAVPVIAWLHHYCDQCEPKSSRPVVAKDSERWRINQ